MVVLSKTLFYEKIDKTITCGHLHIWNKSCVGSQLKFSGNVVIGSLKFFLPIYIVKAIINHKKLKDKQYVKSLIMEEIRSVIYGMLIGDLFLASNCVLSKLCGRVLYYNLGLISGLVSGLALLIETKENKILDTLIFFNLVIDAIFKNLDYFNIFKLTNSREILIFMMVSGLLMCQLQNRKESTKLVNFWFYTPPKFKQNIDVITRTDPEQRCEHKLTCGEYTLQGFQKYFLMGYGFGIVRKLIPQMLSTFQKPQKLFSIFISKDNVRFGMFIGAYVGLYRYIMCYLLKTNRIDPKYYGAIAGLISGATYSISPNLQVLTVGITTLLQIFYHRILKTFYIKNQVVPTVLVYMVSHALLLHNAVVCKESCPSYYVNMLNICTNKMFGKIYNSIISQYFGTQIGKMKF